MQSMTPSKTTTTGQIDKAVANYRALLEKHSKRFNAENLQIVLGQSELAKEQFDVLRRRVEITSNLTFHRIKVNRNRTPQQALDATVHTQFTNQEVVDNMPKGKGKEVEICFFKPEEWEYTRPDFINDDDLEKALKRRGLISDPFAVMAWNEANPSFADEKFHGIHWKDANGNWCFIAFNRWDGECRVDVDRNGCDWYVPWCFAGVRKLVL